MTQVKEQHSSELLIKHTDFFLIKHLSLTQIYNYKSCIYLIIFDDFRHKCVRKQLLPFSEPNINERIEPVLQFGNFQTIFFLFFVFVTEREKYNNKTNKQTNQ